MQHRNLGSSSLRVSIVGLGCNNFGGRIDLEATRKVVDKAIETGITLFDTADAYGEPKGGSEECLGAILSTRRKQIVLASKCGLPMDESGTRQGASRRYITQAIEASLKRLRTDWIDLYQIHRPDPKTPIEETMRTLQDLIQQGKVRHIGCSNFSAAQLAEAQACAKQASLTPFVSAQDQYSLLVRDIEGELSPSIKKHGLGLLPYFPLASGLLTGKYKRGAPMPEGSRLAYSQRHINRFGHDANMQAVEQLEAFVTQRGHTLLELAFGWLLSKPFVASVIAGATKPEQIEANGAAAGWIPSAEECTEVERITANLPKQPPPV
jgi:aryl-alcohol dehydrogenase-like predicted oxidoreductase